MSPAQNREHPAPDGGGPRPGGGTYPVRAAVSPQPPPPPPAPPRAPRARAVHQSRRGSPRTLVALLLGTLALLTLVLLAVSLGGYLPAVPDAEEPAAAEPAADGATSP